MSLEGRESREGIEQLREPKRILEIGADASGLVTSEFPAKAGDEFVHTVLNYTAAQVEEIKRIDPRVQAVTGDLMHLPFKDESFDELWLQNVCGDPEIVDTTTTQYSRGGRTREGHVLSECARVLKKGGTINIVELYSPEYAEKYRRYSVNHLRKLGLGKKIVYEGERAIQFIESHGKEMTDEERDVWTEDAADAPFIMVLEKV